MWPSTARAIGNIIVGDDGNSCIRKISPDGHVTTLARYDTLLQNSYLGLAIDADGDVVIANGESSVKRLVARLVPFDGVPTRSMAADYLRMLADPAHADVTFVVGEVEHITAHRSVLVARSAYFSTMLTSRFRDGQSATRVQIDDASPEAFRTLLRYLYSDIVDVSDTVVIDLMRLAHRYCIAPLCRSCIRHFAGALRADNAIAWWIQTEKHCLEDLQAEALGFVVRSFDEIRASAPETVKLLEDQPQLATVLMLALPSLNDRSAAPP